MVLKLRRFTAKGNWNFVKDLPGWSRQNDILENGSCKLLDNQSDLFGIWEHQHDDPADYVLNHIAYSTNNLDFVVQSFNDHPGNKFHDGVGWDPIVDREIRTVHFYNPKGHYVTLREDSDPLKPHHIGFECSSIESVVGAKPVLVKYNLPIIWEGVIDGSYVLHFKGPDKNIHDFFYVR